MSSTVIEQNTCEAHLLAAAAEIEALKLVLLEKQNQLMAMESACLRGSDRQVELEDSVIAWQDKYDRLYESHKRVQKVNQGLEDKLLKLVDRNTSERAQLTSDVATLSVRLAQANFNISKLQREIERYKSDMNVAIQLLQCKPESYMPQKLSALPIDTQSKVSAYMRLETNSHSDSEGSTSGVGVATSASYKVLPASDSPPPTLCPFPPTAMVYSMRGLDEKSNANSTVGLNNNNNNSKESINKNNNSNNRRKSASSLNASTNTLTDPDLISPLLMAQFLEDELKVGEVKHCDTCQCSKQDLTVLADVARSYTVATQTPFHQNSVGVSVGVGAGAVAGISISVGVGGGVGGGVGCGIGTSSNGGGNLNEPLTQLCLRCNSNLNSPSRTNSPYLMKLVKSSDSVISETKSSVSGSNDMEKLFMPSKKDDLMVNPILGHHRLCDRTSGSGAGLVSCKQIGGAKLTSTMLYPTTHLGAYASEKYLLELRTGYQRRFIDGGGTALNLLDKYEPTNMPQKPPLPEVPEVLGNGDEDDEVKPLICATSQVILLDPLKTKITEVCELLPNQMKSPASSVENTKNNLIHSTISGSVNSLWSKTSSCDGAKMFENFNRNLIKTIKAENPKYRGPRLCAMRIQQNGQSNILLDNIESLDAVAPIVYKRRERLLDEELDDTKDIITSNSTMSMVPIMEQPIPNDDDDAARTIDSISMQTDSWAQNANTQTQSQEIEDECDIPDIISCSDTGGGSGEYKGGGAMAVIAALPEPTAAEHLIDQQFATKEVEAHADRILKVTDAVKLADQQSSVLNLMDLQTTPEKLKPQLEESSPSYEILLNESSSKNSHNSKSCTQSSSICDVLDFQENVILRRQQLSRVAEWVQSNTQQLEQKQQQQVISTVNQCDSSGTERQSSFSTLDQLDTVSMEKLSMDSGYKTTPQQQTNGNNTDNQPDDACKSIGDSLSPKTDTASNQNNVSSSNNNNNGNKPQTSIAVTSSSNTNSQNIDNISNHIYHPNQVINTTNTYFRRTTRSGLPVAYTTPDPNAHRQGNNNSNCTITTNASMQAEQTTCDILNYKYYPRDNDKTHAIKAELHTTTQHVDIAQMEYNVKQFLLKQNEWSMQSTSTPTTNATNQATTSNASNIAPRTVSQTTQVVAHIEQQQQQQQPFINTLRHTKIFSTAGFGPGIGERVHVAPAPAPTSNGGAAENDTTQLRSMPQRTETNL